MEIGLEKRREVSSLADLEAAEERARAPVNFQKTTFSKNGVRSPETCYAHTVAGCGTARRSKPDNATISAVTYNTIAQRRRSRADNEPDPNGCCVRVKLFDWMSASDALTS